MYSCSLSEYLFNIANIVSLSLACYLQEGIVLAKVVQRQSPIGTDRNHSRYWIFSDGTPGLFVEKGRLLLALQTLFSLPFLANLKLSRNNKMCINLFL